jgi:hypothetical protein
MPILDPVKNFAIVTVSTGYDNAATTVVLSTGHGAKLPDPATDGAFNLPWFDSTTYSSPSDDPNAEIVRVTARSGDTLTVARAQEGTSAASHNTAGKTYKMILAPTKKLRDDIETSLQQAPRYAEDSGASDSYAITLTPAPAAYYVGMVVVFKANTTNTGAATLNVNGLGAKTIKKNHDQDLADGDIESGQIVELVYDGTNFQMQSQVANANPVIFAMQRRSGSQSIPNTTVTKILTNTADKTVGDINNDTANSRIVINKDGFYRLSLYLGFSDSTAGQYRIPGFRKNGATVLDVYYAKTTGVGSIRITANHYLQLVANDYIEISGYQDSGGALNVIDGTYFVVERMSD